jgi:hypothetical protein
VGLVTLARDLKPGDRIGDHIVKDCELLEGPMGTVIEMGPIDLDTMLQPTTFTEYQKPAFEIVLVYLVDAHEPDEVSIHIAEQWRWYRADEEV